MVKDLSFAVTVAQGDRHSRGPTAGPEGGIRGAHRARVRRPAHRRDEAVCSTALGELGSNESTNRAVIGPSANGTAGADLRF